MSLAALIAAYHESDEPGGALRATLPLAGRTLVERQARLAAAAGAHPVVILVERLPAELNAALDRLRSEGVNATVARSVAEAAEAVEPEQQLLLIADGLVADKAHVARLKAADGAALLTLPDNAVDDRFERIDAHSRWAGMAILDGALLKRTAATLGDWDLQSTLLRHILQGGARQLALRADDPVLIAERADDLAEAQRRIVERARRPAKDWVSRYLLGPVEQSGARALMPTSISPGMLYIGSAALTGLSAILFTDGWLWPGLLLLLAATPLDAIARKLAALRMQPGGKPRWWKRGAPAVAGAALLALAYTLSRTQGWGCIALAVTAIAFLLAMDREGAPPDVDGRIFLAERKGMSWLMLPFAAAGAWATGLGALALYAAASFFWVQHQVHRPPAPTRKD